MPPILLIPSQFTPLGFILSLQLVLFPYNYNFSYVLVGIQFWLVFSFGWYSVLVGIQFWLVFSFGWYSVLVDYWIGLEAHTMKQTLNDLIYWMWINTGLNMEYKNWCPDQINAKDLVCAYVKAGEKDVCWMFSDCGKSNAVSGFICENKMKHTDNYEIVKYKNHEYLIYYKDHKPRSWYQARDMCRTVWIGLQSYIQTVNSKKYMYWKWTGPENDIRLKNWCLHIKFQKATMCGYVLHNTLCWMAEKCTFNDVTSFVCEDKHASTQNPAHAFQHYLAISYHKPITATTTATTTTTTSKPTTTTITTTTPMLTTTTTTTNTPTTTTNTPTTTTNTPTTTTNTPTTTTTTPTPTTTTFASTTTTIHGVVHNPSKNHEVTFNGISYHFYDNTVSQAQANKICQRNGHSLVTIDDAPINVFLQTEIVENKRTHNYNSELITITFCDYWIGLEAHTMKQPPNDLMYWMWINTGLNMEYKNWCPDQINAKDLVCAYVKAGEKDVCWMFSDCGNSNAVSGFICENKMKHTDNYEIVKYKNHEYLIYYKDHKPRSWYQARDMCHTVWVGLQSYIQTVNGNKYMYWKWTGPGNDIRKVYIQRCN
uniref:C-type lectin domain-containing protein n=1 Tax=Strigamia maritima TaxID=126957 RepID=T1JGV8_STRMM